MMLTMTTTLETKFEIKSWDENPYRENPDGSKYARCEVVLAGTGDGLTEAGFDGLLYYRPDGTSSFVMLMRVAGEIGGRAGSFVLRGEGTFDGTAARSELTIVPASGTGRLAGIAGSGTSVSTRADYPFMPVTLAYDVE
jgi:Protein of unknown function (DUF3224)